MENSKDNMKMQKVSTKNVIIIRPRTTEKTAILQEDNIYTFDVDSKANKSEIKKEIKRLYKVVPVKVNIAKAEGKVIFSRGRLGKKKSVKKAYVFLKKGDKITL